jgi:hypothetical protein
MPNLLHTLSSRTFLYPQLSYVIWRQKCYAKIKNQLINAALELIHKERTGIKSDMTLVRALVQSMGTSYLLDHRSCS